MNYLLLCQKVLPVPVAVLETVWVSRSVFSLISSPCSQLGPLGLARRVHPPHPVPRTAFHTALVLPLRLTLTSHSILLRTYVLLPSTTLPTCAHIVREQVQSKSPSGPALGSWEPLRQNGNLGCFGFGGSAPPPASASASSTSSSIASCSYEPQHQLQLGQTGPGWRGRRHARVHTATHSFTSFQLTCWRTALSGPGVSGVGT